MAGLVKKRFESCDETRAFENGRLEIVGVGQLGIGRGVFEPGWRWSEHVQPLAGTDSCQAAHTGYVLEGRMVVRMDDGEEVEFASGDVFHMPPGHDAWIVGDETCVILDVTGTADYAKQG